MTDQEATHACEIDAGCTFTRTRYAEVSGARDANELRAYLPDNYKVIARNGKRFVIAGSDVAGWTLEDYVEPRLGSGLMGCREIDSLADITRAE